MRIIAIEQELPDAAPSRFRDLAVDEAATLHELWIQGIVREPYFRADKEEAVLILEVQTLEMAAKELSKLPYVAEGLIKFELIPLRTYPGFKRLFSKFNPENSASRP